MHRQNLAASTKSRHHQLDWFWMYLRFTSDKIDERTGRPMGAFTVAYELLDEGELSKEEEVELRGLLAWFSAHLQIPTKFSRNRNDSHKNTQGISWIKDTANEVVSSLWGLKDFLERQGFSITVVRTERPGRVVYEDKLQVIAEPFHQELNG